MGLHVTFPQHIPLLSNITNYLRAFTSWNIPMRLRILFFETLRFCHLSVILCRIGPDSFKVSSSNFVTNPSRHSIHIVMEGVHERWLDDSFVPTDCNESHRRERETTVGRSGRSERQKQRKCCSEYCCYLIQQTRLTTEAFAFDE